MEGDKIDPASLNVLISPIMLSAYILSYNERRSRQEMESLYDVDDGLKQPRGDGASLIGSNGHPNLTIHKTSVRVFCQSSGVQKGRRSLLRTKCWNTVLISENYASRAMVGDAKTFSLLALHFDSETIVRT